MKVTSVRLKHADPADRQRGLLAYVSFVLDGEIVVHNAKLFGSSSKRPDGLFVSFPTHPVMARCGVCGKKGAVKDLTCRHCGAHYPQPEDHRRLHSDVCHPITSGCRKRIEDAIFAAWRAEGSDEVPAAPHREEIPDEAFGEGVELDA